MIARWQAWRLRRATPRDLLSAIAVILLATLAVSVGRRARASLTPRAAVETARILDDLELPSRLPNAPVLDQAGAATPIFDRMTKSRAAVAFYAPWCGPCQEELPALSRTLGKSAELFVVITKAEDVEHTKRQLANIGLRDVRLYVDMTGALAKEGRVTALPTTFAVSRRGAVLARTKGYSFGSMYQLAKKVDRGTGAGFDDVEADE